MIRLAVVHHGGTLRLRSEQGSDTEESSACYQATSSICFNPAVRRRLKSARRVINKQPIGTTEEAAERNNCRSFDSDMRPFGASSLRMTIQEEYCGALH